MKKQVIILFILLFIFPVIGSADNLVYISNIEKAPSDKLLNLYEKSVYCEDRFLLVHKPADWQPVNSNQQILTEWDDAKYYYVLYPVKEFSISEIQKHSFVLLSKPDFLIIETGIEILNDLETFHAFKIARIFNQKIQSIQTEPIALSKEFFLNNPVIQQMVDTVSIDSVWFNIDTLQSMERYTTNASAINSSDYLKNYFERFGFDTVYYQTWQSGSIPNVIAVKNGMLYPDEIYLVGGHYDTYTNGAPGADDNGSGTAAIMEIARVMSAQNYKRTLKYVLFSGEEMGLYGSAAYASQAAGNGENILGMINMDMIAYVQPGDQIDVDVVSNTASQDLYDAYVLASQTYVPSLQVVPGSLPGWASSDHASFWNNGFKAIFPFEDSDNYSPYIHSSQDILGTSANNQTLAELGTKSVVAALANLVELADARITGTVSSASDLQPIENAKVTFNADSVFTAANGSFTTPALSPGNYQIIISAAGFERDTINHDLNEYEVFNIAVNLIPAGSVRPYIHISDIVIDDDSTGNSLGNGNGIVDAGETIEIMMNFINSGNLKAVDIYGVVQNSDPRITILQDTIFADSIDVDSVSLSNNSIVLTTDPETPPNTDFTFTVNLGYQGFNNTSSFCLNVKNRGDVLIIEDDDNEGGLAVHTTALDCLHISYDLANSTVLQQEMDEYQYVIWFCGDDYSGTLTSDDQAKLSSYLDNGGKLFISGTDIGYEIHNDPFYSTYLKANYLADGPYTATTSVYGIASDPISGDFTGGLGINDNYVDQINPTGGATQIFEYTAGGSYYNCGVKYDGDYQLVYLTFCFENITNADSRIVLLNNIWTWFGGNATGFQQKDNTVFDFHLSQNYPNPFNPVTTIEFSIPKTQKVKLEIFNILGQKVETLISKNLKAGIHTAQFNASNYASGVYFYRIETDNFEQTKKLILLR